MSATAERVQYRDALANREFAGVLLAQIASDTGDQIARVAIALLILDRTGSAFGSAIAFAVSFAPSVVAGPLLGPLADRVPRRHLMLIADLARAVLVSGLALLAVPQVPVWVPLVLLLVTEVFTSPFEAARTALIPDLLEEPNLVSTALGLMRSMSFFDQVFGLVLGGAIVGAASPKVALFVDAASFAFSYVVVRFAVRRRPAALVGERTTPGLLWRDMVEGGRLLAQDRGRRVLVVFAWLLVLPTIAPEAVGLAYARHAGAANVWGAALIAAPIAGTALGSLLVGNRPLGWQRVALRPLAAVMCLLLLPSWLSPPLIVIWFGWLVAGFFAGFYVSIMSLVTLLTGAAQRGRVASVAGAGLNLFQAISFPMAGFIADRLDPGRAVAVSGAFGLVIVLLAGLVWPRAELRRRVRRLTGESLAKSV